MISIKQLNYALAVEKSLHFRKAAEQCNISQSALSTGLYELEKQLGLQIFERDNKKVLITPVGKTVLARARLIVTQVKDLEELADSQKAPLSSPMTIGAIPTIAPYLLPKVFPTLYEQFPEVQMGMVEEQSQGLVDLVRSGEIDTAILALPYPCDGLLTMEFWQEDFYWVSRRDDKKAQKKSITTNEIDASKLMLLKDGHCLKNHILDACKITGDTAQDTFSATSLTTLIQLVLGNLGTTLIPEMALGQLLSGNDLLSAIHLAEPGPHRRIAFIVRPNYSRLSSVEALMQVCRQALTKDSGR